MFLFFCQPTSNAIKASMWIEKKIIIWCQILFYGVPVSVITYVSRDGSIPLFQNRYRSDTKHSEYLPIPISIRYSTTFLNQCRISIYPCVLTCSSLFCVLHTIY